MKVDTSKIASSTNQMKRSLTELKSAKVKASAITVPSDFMYGGEIRSIPSLIESAISDVNNLVKQNENQVKKIEETERKNKEMLAGLNLRILLGMQNFVNDIDNGQQVKIAQRRMWTSLRISGLTDIQVAAIMGNIFYEASNNKVNKNREEALKKYAKSKGKSEDDVDIQISYLLAEITGKGDATKFVLLNKPAFSNQTEKYNGLQYSNLASKEGFYSAKNLEEATAAILYSYSDPNYEEAEKSYLPRLKEAQNIYRQYHYDGMSDEDVNLSICQGIMNGLLKRDAHYPTAARGWKLPSKIEEAQDGDYDVCCVTYVDMYLYESGAIPAYEIDKYDINNIMGEKGLIKMLEDNNWQEIDKSQISSGDILICPGSGQDGHTVVYVSDGVIYDQKSGVVSSKGNAPNRGPVDENDYNEYMNGDKYVAYTRPDNPVLKDLNLDKLNNEDVLYKAKVSTKDGDGVNVREKPDINSKIKDSLVEGSEIDIVEEQGDWGRFSKGWVKLQYTKKEEDKNA